MEIQLIRPLLAVFLAIILTGSKAKCQLPSTDLSTLHGYLAESHHTPLCVLLRKRVSTLEKKLVKLTSDEKHPLISWRMAGVNMSQIADLPQYLLQDSEMPRLPHLRCFLGALLSFDFEQPKKSISESLQLWLMDLLSRQQQMTAVGVEMIRASASSYRYTLVVFPTADQHTQLEEAAFQTANSVAKETSVQVIIVHPSSPNYRQITEEFQVHTVPAVLLITKGLASQEERKIFSVHELLTNQLETKLRADLIPARHLTDENFKSEVMEVKTSELYKPYLVGFYAWWEKDVSTFLSFLRLAVEELTEMEADIRFGVLDVSSSPTVMSQYLSADSLKKLPFIALFQREQGTTTVRHTELYINRPSTYTVYTGLQQAGLVLRNRLRHTIHFAPYGYTDPRQVCMVWEGPHGFACSSSSNASITEWPSSLDSRLSQDTTKVTVEEKLGTIPLLSADKWHSVMKPFSGDEQYSDVANVTQTAVKIVMLIFIRYPCRSCEQNEPTFQQLHQEFNGSISLYIVNCSRDRSLCDENHVSGFPTVIAFRAYIPPPSVAASCSSAAASAPVTVRQDYHGVLTVSAIQDWVKVVSRGALTHLKFKKVTSRWIGRESTRLVATLMPRDSRYLPLPPGKNKAYFYSVECLQVLCERLFGLAQCFTIYSSEVPQSEYQGEDLPMTVTKIVFERRDAVRVTVMELGKSQVALLEAETTGALHMFHQPHSYKLRLNQKCEEDHGLCNRFLEEFTRDHIRLPVTLLTSEIFHTHDNPLFKNNLPILLALSEPENISNGAPFLQLLNQVAVNVYKEVVIASLDVTMFRAWAGAFVPRDYGRRRAELDSWGQLGIYPRFCMFYWSDHTRAAFYPPVQHHGSLSHVTSSEYTDFITLDTIIEFVHQFLKDPDKHLIPTERF